MIEKKTVWAVTRDLEIIERTAIIEDGKVLASKYPDVENSEYGEVRNLLRYFETEEMAKECVENEEKSIRDMIPKVKKFIESMEYSYELRKKLGIEKKDYLDSYYKSSYLDELGEEQEYSMKLEVFIKSRMLNIGGRMIPIDQVREIQWYSTEDAEDYEADKWKAVLTTTNGGKYSTCSVADVRLIWATTGKCVDIRFFDNDIDYKKDEEK